VIRARHLGLAVFFVASAARADGEYPPDFRIPLRVGGGYDGQLHAGGLSTLPAIEVDVAKLSRVARLVLAADFDMFINPDAKAFQDQLKMRLGAAVGIIVRPTRSWALVVHEGGVMIVMNDPGPAQTASVVGGGLATTAYLYPWYVPFDDTAGFEHSVTRAILSGVAIWARGEVDWTSYGRGGSLAMGMSLDVIRFLFSPILSLVSPGPPRPVY